MPSAKRYGLNASRRHISKWPPGSRASLHQKLLVVISIQVGHSYHPYNYQHNYIDRLHKCLSITYACNNPLIGCISWLYKRLCLLGVEKMILNWNFNQNTNIFIHKNAAEIIVCEMAAILSRGEVSQQQTKQQSSRPEMRKVFPGHTAFMDRWIIALKIRFIGNKLTLILWQNGIINLI